MIGNKYDPRNKQYDELQQTFSCGQTIFEELLEDLKPDKTDKATRQSWIITGPRGSGKSHLITLLYRTIAQDNALSSAYLPLIFPEELFQVDSLYRLLLIVFEELFHTLPTTNQTEGHKKKFQAIKSKRLKGSQKNKNAQKQALAKELLDLLLSVRKDTNKKIILFLENLQYLLRGQIPEYDQKILRGFLNENEQVFIIIGTALTLFDEIENYGKPFYHFFRIRSLTTLDKNGIQTFIKKLAKFYNHNNIEARIETNRHYIYTYNILTGGNPRLVLFLYELLIDNDQLNTRIILEKVSELTPYFLDKTQMESPQRKLILDALVTGPPAQTATEISDYINEEQKSITEQLKRLCAEGWIKQIQLQAKNIKKKEVFYTLRDYFYRIWYQSRTSRLDQSEVYCLAELTTLLFNKKEIQDRLKRHEELSSPQSPMYEKAWEMVNDPKYIANINLLVESAKQSETEEINELWVELKNRFLQKDWNGLLKSTKKLLDYPTQGAVAYMYSGIAYGERKEYETSINQFKIAVGIKPNYYQAWLNMGLSYSILNKFDKAIECYQKGVDIKPGDHNAWYIMGNSYRNLNKFDKAIECYQKAVDIKPGDHKAWYNMGSSYYLLKNDQNFHLSFLQHIQHTSHFEQNTFFGVQELIKIADSLFNSTESLHTLLDKNSSLSEKLDAIGKLILLNKFTAVQDSLDPLLSDDLPEKETKVVSFYLQGKLLDLLASGKNNEDVTILFKYWIILNVKIQNHLGNGIEKTFFEFIFLYINLVDKKNLSLELIDNAIDELYAQGIEMSDVLLNILEAIKEPDSRNAQKWMADPLFKTIVTHPALTEKDEIE